MGLIKAIGGAVGGVLSEQWLDYYYCDAMTPEVLAVKGKRRESGRSANTKSSENIISNGSIIAVADGQCMIIVEQGKVVDLCAEPGEYKYDASTEPSIFSGNLGAEVKAVFKNIGKRFTFGGEPPKDQRVYYFNTKELIGNKYGTPSPVPFRVVDERAGIDMDIAVRCFGEYSYKLVNPILFYTNVTGNVEETFLRSAIESQLKTEFLTALQPAFARISAMGIRYSALPGHTMELANAMKEELSAQWRNFRGIEVQKVGVSSVRAGEEDERMIKELQRNAAFLNPAVGAAYLVGAQGQAMQDAAKNENGAMGAFMGMGMAQGIGGVNANNLYQQGQMNGSAQGDAPMPGTPSKFTQNSFAGGQTGNAPAMSAPSDVWVCSCGTKNQGNFCTACGKPRPAAPASQEAPACPACGWRPEAGTPLPNFCPNCGAPFNPGKQQ